MSTTSPPYYTSTFGAPHQEPSSATPTGTHISDYENDAEHPHTNTHSHSHSHSSSSSSHQHRSSLLNKLDPRVHSNSNMSSQDHHQPISHGEHAPISSIGQGVTQASAAGGAPASGSVPSDPPPQYEPRQESRTAAYEGSRPSGSGTADSKAVRKGEDLGQGVQSAAAGIHGLGESLRGGLTAAVDRAFGHNEGVARNEAVAKKGEQQMESGQFQGGAK